MTTQPSPLTGIVPFLMVKGAKAAADFYERAFGAVEVARMDAQDGERLMYCRMAVNGGTLMFADDFPEYTDGISRAPPPDRPTSVTLHLQVEDCDAAYERAITAGASPVMPPADMFWGDRYAQVRDPFGHAWSIGHTLSASA